MYAQVRTIKWLEMTRPEITGRKIGVRYVGNVALARYLNVAPMSVWRWKRDPDLNVPSAAVINGREYNDLDAWDAWLRSRAVSLVEHSCETKAQPP